MMRWLLTILVVLLTSSFVALNWGAFNTPTTLWLGFMGIDAPLGLVMLGFLLLFALLFGAWVIYLQGKALLETRRHGRELQTQRDIADKAEASRFAELSQLMTAEFQRLSQAIGNNGSTTQTRLAELEQRLVSRVDQTGNSLQASISELDDRLERGGPNVTVPPDRLLPGP